MNVPRAEMERDLKAQEKELADDISSLTKKSKYLEKQYVEANNQLRDIVRPVPLLLLLQNSFQYSSRSSTALSLDHDTLHCSSCTISTFGPIICDRT